MLVLLINMLFNKNVTLKKKIYFIQIIKTLIYKYLYY